MLEYLVNYGVSKKNLEYFDLDVTDKLQLQEQINNARKNYHELLILLDKVQHKYLECSAKLAKKAKELIENNDSSVRTNILFSTNEEYLAIEAEQQALKAGINMINNQIDYYKNDLRILNSIFYNKF